jgi:hypothetical protein
MVRRIAVSAALIAGLASIADWFVQLRHVQPDAHWQGIDLMIEVLFALSLLGAIVALQGIPAWIGATRAARIAAIVAQIGFALLFLSAVVSLMACGNTLGIAFSAGLLLALLGLLVFAIAGLVRSERRWAAPVPFVGLLLSVVAAPVGGQLLLGLAWLALAFAMTAQVRRTAIA